MPDPTDEEVEGFSPCASVTKASNIPGASKLEMFVNYNNTFSATGSGHLKFTDLSVVQVEADISCSRVL